MTLKSNAAQIGEGYRARAAASAQATAAARLDQLNRASTFVLAMLDARVTKHFDDKDAAGEPPYDGNNRALVHVVQADDFASGNGSIGADAFQTLDARQRQIIVQRVGASLTEAGFTVLGTDEKLAELRMHVLIHDPQYRPVAEPQVKARRFTEELGKL